MKKWMDSWGLIVGIVIVGSAFMALTASGPERNFGRTFTYALVGFLTLATSMISTIMLVGRIGRNTENETAWVGIACVIGVFVTTPIAFWVVFKVLDYLMGW